jgi:hypothetical protein
MSPPPCSCRSQITVHNKMSNHYSAATLTPIASEVKREAENLSVKSEPRVNGFGGGPGAGPVPGGSTGPPHLPEPTSSASADGARGGDFWYNSGREQTCCLVDSGRRCARRAGNASYSKRIQKTVTQRKLKLYMDNSVSVFMWQAAEKTYLFLDAPFLIM